MVPWWYRWTSIINEYWLGTSHFVAGDLNGTAIILTVPAKDHLIITVDRQLLDVLTDLRELTWLSRTLRIALQREPLNTPGLILSIPVTQEHAALYYSRPMTLHSKQEK